MKGRQRSKMWVLITVGAIVAAAAIFLSTPYSGTLRDFERDVKSYSDRLTPKNDVFTEGELASLPEPVRKHFAACGYTGRAKMTSMSATMKAVPLFDSADKPPMIVDYNLRSFADEPVRLAYIKTSMYGIPFEAYDSYQNGVGFMKGVLGKAATVFDHRGPGMDKSQLLTWLGECFLIPSSVLSGYISWEPIDEHRAKATVTHSDMTCGGVFTFSEQGFVESFRTSERERTNSDGSMERQDWSAVYGDWQERNGVYLPNSIKVIWHEPAGDLVYFDTADFDIVYDVMSEYNAE